MSEQIDTTAFAFHDRDNDGQVTYYPWTDGWAVGFRAVHDDGRVEYIYLNPSGESDDGVPNVFLYQGTEGDVRQDPAYHHYDLFLPDYPQQGQPSGYAQQWLDHKGG